jgi:hypothetical protein
MNKISVSNKGGNGKGVTASCLSCYPLPVYYLPPSRPSPKGEGAGSFVLWGKQEECGSGSVALP